MGTETEQKELRAKLNGILEALAAGRSCEQILAADRALSYRDIFHAVAEAPTSYWQRASETNPGARSEPKPEPIPPLVRHRAD